jgi:V/A-type H+-transporting ATPase subunit E
MKSVEENLELLSRAILSEANDEAEQIKADAKAKADAIRQRAERQAAAERDEILQRARQDAERIHSQTIATTQLKARTMQLEHREKLLKQVFDAVRDQLSSVEEWTEYESIAERLLREAIERLNASKAHVRADENTLKLFTEEKLTRISEELKVSLRMGNPLSQGIGIQAESTNGHLHYDNTLETRLRRLESVLRAPVYHILIGESL